MIGMTREQIIKKLSKYHSVAFLETLSDQELAERMARINPCDHVRTELKGD